MRHSLFTILAFLAMLVTSNQIAFAQTDSAAQKKQTARSEKLKKKIEKIGLGGKITAVRLDGRDFYGTVTGIEADSFEMIEVDSKQTVSFKYFELKKIHKGDGERNLITGRRNNPQRGWLYVLAGIGALIGLVAIGVADKDF